MNDEMREPEYCDFCNVLLLRSETMYCDVCEDKLDDYTADLRGRCEAMERMLREAKAVAFEGGFLLLQAGDWVWFTGEYPFGIIRSVHKRQSIIEAFEAAREAGKEQTLEAIGGE